MLVMILLGGNLAAVSIRRFREIDPFPDQCLQIPGSSTFFDAWKTGFILAWIFWVDVCYEKFVEERFKKKGSASISTCRSEGRSESASFHQGMRITGGRSR